MKLGVDEESVDCNNKDNEEEQKGNIFHGRTSEVKQRGRKVRNKKMRDSKGYKKCTGLSRWV